MILFVFASFLRRGFLFFNGSIFRNLRWQTLQKLDLSSLALRCPRDIVSPFWRSDANARPWTSSFNANLAIGCLFDTTFHTFDVPFDFILHARMIPQCVIALSFGTAIHRLVLREGSVRRTILSKFSKTAGFQRWCYRGPRPRLSHMVSVESEYSRSSVGTERFCHSERIKISSYWSWFVAEARLQITSYQVQSHPVT